MRPMHSVRPTTSNRCPTRAAIERDLPSEGGRRGFYRCLSADVVLIPVIVTVVPDTEMSLLAITVEPFLTRIFALVVGAEESMPSLANIVMFDPLVYATGRFGLLELFHVGADPSGLS